jgi:hypothetical protein
VVADAPRKPGLRCLQCSHYKTKCSFLDSKPAAKAVKNPAAPVENVEKSVEDEEEEDKDNETIRAPSAGPPARRVQSVPSLRSRLVPEVVIVRGPSAGVARRAATSAKVARRAATAVEEDVLEPPTQKQLAALAAMAVEGRAAASRPAPQVPIVDVEVAPAGKVETPAVVLESVDNAMAVDSQASEGVNFDN